jgi:hypothetical protein
MTLMLTLYNYRPFMDTFGWLIDMLPPIGW